MGKEEIRTWVASTVPQATVLGTVPLEAGDLIVEDHPTTMMARPKGMTLPGEYLRLVSRPARDAFEEAARLGVAIDYVMCFERPNLVPPEKRVEQQRRSRGNRDSAAWPEGLIDRETGEVQEYADPTEDEWQAAFANRACRRHLARWVERRVPEFVRQLVPEGSRFIVLGNDQEGGELQHEIGEAELACLFTAWRFPHRRAIIRSTDTDILPACLYHLGRAPRTATVVWQRPRDWMDLGKLARVFRTDPRNLAAAMMFTQNDYVERFPGVGPRTMLLAYAAHMHSCGELVLDGEAGAPQLVSAGFGTMMERVREICARPRQFRLTRERMWQQLDRTQFVLYYVHFMVKDGRFPVSERPTWPGWTVLGPTAVYAPTQPVTGRLVRYPQGMLPQNGGAPAEPARKRTVRDAFGETDSRPGVKSARGADGEESAPKAQSNPLRW